MRAFHAVLMTLSGLIGMVSGIYGEYSGIAAFFQTTICEGTDSCRWVLEGWPPIVWIPIFAVYLALSPFVILFFAWSGVMAAVLVAWAAKVPESFPSSSRPPGLRYHRRTHILTWCGVAWLSLAALVILVAAAWGAMTFGLLGVVAAFNPFNVWNVAAWTVTFAPGFVILHFAAKATRKDRYTPDRSMLPLEYV